MATPTVIRPTETVRAFIESNALVDILRGPRREGKTFGGYLKALHKAHQLPGHARPLRGACIRDTGVNLQRTAVQTLKELEQLGVTVEWRGPHDHRTGALIDGVVDVEFFGLDRMEEVNKLQGMGAGFFWLEEPAPAADISGGIPVEVFGVAVTSLQQAGVTEPWIQITMNPPDSDHWTMEIAQRLRESGLDGTARRRPLVKVWRIPPGENPHITAEQRGEWRAGLEASGRKDLVARLIEGRVGQIILGEAVMPEYHDEHHVGRMPLPILRDATIVRCYDFGLTPVVIETQITPMGRWHILWPFQRVNAGIKQLLEEEVIPWEAEYLRGFRGIFRDVGDHAGTQREQSNSETTAVKVLEELLHTTFEPGPIEWSARRQALKNVLDTMIRGEPKFVVDPDALAVRRALRAGWHYPKDGLGRITPTLEAAKRASGLHDHVGHALAHAASVLFPVEDTLRQRRPVRPVRRQAFGSGVERKELSWLGV